YRTEPAPARSSSAPAPPKPASMRYPPPSAPQQSMSHYRHSASPAPQSGPPRSALQKKQRAATMKPQVPPSAPSPSIHQTLIRPRSAQTEETDTPSPLKDAWSNHPFQVKNK